MSSIETISENIKNNPIKTKISPIVVITTILFILLFIFWGDIINFCANLKWFDSVGKSSVFWFVFNAKLLSGLFLLLLSVLILGLNYFFMNKLKVHLPQKISADGVIHLPSAGNSVALSLLFIISVCISVFFFFDGIYSYGVFADFLYKQPFNVKDPLFGFDVSFYVFSLPFFGTLLNKIFILLAIAFFMCIYFYIFGRDIKSPPKNFNVTRPLKIHILIICALIFIVTALLFQISKFSLLCTTTGMLQGAFYSDVYGRIPIFDYLSITSIVFAGLIFLDLKRDDWKNTFRYVLALIVLIFTGIGVYPSILQKLIVSPNELSKEKVFIERNIDYTRRAFELDKFVEREFPANSNLTFADIKENKQTTDNIRLWDPQPLLEAYSELQEIRTYYKFFDVDFDRYFIDGVYKQIMLSPRELSKDRIPDRKWINETFTYTHGYGCCFGPVNSASSDGLPDFYVKDIPPVYEKKDIPQPPNPAIYYGELTDSYCIVKSKEREFDYPSGDENIYCTYEGKAGAEINSLWSRIVFSFYFGDFKILLSSEILPESRILFNRRVGDILKKITPYVIYDPDPYLVSTKDGFYWIADGYFATNKYPYSESYSGLNYIRNSVKAVINAYDGETSFYIFDDKDPLLKTKMAMFKDLFKPSSEMPSELKKHVRYPESLFKIKADMYARYHMRDVRVFYNREDLWKTATTGTSSNIMQPYYTILRLPPPEGKVEEFVLMLPYSPVRKSNMTSLITARCDEHSYGEVIVYTFPKDKLIFGPSQIDSRIDQDPEISKQLTLWTQGGSHAIRGGIMVIPIKDSLIYVEPLFLAANNGKIPQLKKIFVVYGDKVAMEDDLDTALKKIFVDPKKDVKLTDNNIKNVLETTSADNISYDSKELIKKASEHFKKAKEAQKNDDWASYGKEINALGKTLELLEKNN